MRDSRITSTIVGISRPERVEETARYAGWDIPQQLWDTLEPLAAPQETWLY
jgi:D-threo-aldose 1-dehydrogenase